MAGIPGWEKALLVTALKRGSLYVVALSADGQSVRGPFSRYFQSDNRYRDTAVSPDGKTIYIATHPHRPGDGGRHHAHDGQQGIDSRVHLPGGGDRRGG